MRIHFNKLCNRLRLSAKLICNTHAQTQLASVLLDKLSVEGQLTPLVLVFLLQ